MINVTNLSPSEFKQGFETDQDAVLIDVRTPEENNEKRLPNSINLDIYAPDFHAEILKLDKTKSYYLYCRSGSRSFHAGLFMSQNGFKKIYNLDCGILGWKYETEKN
ncbi:MAG: rhodanese-like domain-containing protein [Ignavibacteriales bacterium]|jgi:rhodanese-related sulfurtransferase|nr:rhodanese-like domain-containing protein [Ignavibacteriales bacterium]MBP7542356.1 rhodanese-like domain-containing protein [Ignavibacteriaceae bacterium]MBK7265192.1 rhodanese-like domain-containing protein [Ignavibacteriales bacterium]MBK8661712.1 rhodanese-like domain-containing protein [Ignavibacteriales bacterium]MBP9122182.1 rhodanese-like domain-containing protein [Ignavibacteriaceae bacterium]